MKKSEIKKHIRELSKESIYEPSLDPAYRVGLKIFRDKVTDFITKNFKEKP
jgi:hypothetical protein